MADSKWLTFIKSNLIIIISKIISLAKMLKVMDVFATKNETKRYSLFLMRKLEI